MVVQCVKVYWKKQLLKHKELVELLEIKQVLIHQIWNGIIVKNVITILYILIKLINVLFVQDVEFSQKMKSETVHIIMQNNLLHKSYGVLVSECNYTINSEIILFFFARLKIKKFSAGKNRIINWTRWFVKLNFNYRNLRLIDIRRFIWIRFSRFIFINAVRVYKLFLSAFSRKSFFFRYYKLVVRGWINLLMIILIYSINIKL